MHSLHTIHVLIACEFVILRHGIKLLIEKEEGFKIIGEANDINGIFNLLHEATPDILIINLNLEAESLDSLCKNVHDKFPNLPILVFMKDSMEISLAELIVGGVRGVIWEENSEDKLTEIIRCVAGGNLYFEDPKNCRINCHLSHKICENPKLDNLNNVLSNRELEILKLISNGLSYKEIATQLFISSRTVESHKNNMLVKLKVKNKNELIRYAIERFNM